MTKPVSARGFQCGYNKHSSLFTVGPSLSTSSFGAAEEGSGDDGAGDAGGGQGSSSSASECTEQCFVDAHTTATVEAVHSSKFCHEYCRSEKPENGGQCRGLDTPQVFQQDVCALAVWDAGAEQIAWLHPTGGLQADGVPASAKDAPGDVNQQLAVADEIASEKKQEEVIDMRSIELQRKLAEAAAQLSVSRTALDRAHFAKLKADSVAARAGQASEAAMGRYCRKRAEFMAWELM